MKTVDMALHYLSLGWSVLPLRPRDKRPAIPWQYLQTSHPTEKAVHDWFDDRPEANVAIVTGAVSELVVLDIDPAHGGDESLEALTAEHGSLPATLRVETGGGGLHVYFRHTGRRIPNKVGLAPGIDVRGEGGYIVAPPSRHPSGGIYRWQPGPVPALADLAPLPEWLRRFALSEAHRSGHTLDYWRGLVKTGVPEGRRNNTIASFAGHLLWHGVDPEVVTELLLCWNAQRCRPPLPPEEVARTVASIQRLHEAEEAD